MPNNITSPAAAGTKLATDQLAGGEHTQIIKLMSGAEDSEERITGTAANGLDVDVTRVSGTVTVDGSGVTQPISAVSLPLATGAASSAKQDTGNTSLNNIDTKTPVLGQALAAASVPVILPAATIATLTPPAAISGFATETGNLAAIKAKTDNIPAQGQALAGASLPVVLPATQISTLTPPAAITGYATETTLGSIKTAVETIDNAIAGTEMQVDVLTLPTVTANATLAAETTKVIGTVNVASGQTIALAAGTAGIGKLTANDGVDIGNVDVASMPALAAGTNAIGKILPTDIDVTAHTNYARKYYTSTGAATDGIIWSPAAGKRWHVTSLIFQVSADATVTFEDDKAGGDDPVLKGEFKAGSGLALTFDERYPFASGEDAADLMVTTSAGNIYVTVVGFEV